MKEIYLGENLNRAINDDGLLILDGRERKNRAARRKVPDGVYQVTRTSGSAPGGVMYWGTQMPRSG